MNKIRNNPKLLGWLMATLIVGAIALPAAPAGADQGTASTVQPTSDTSAASTNTPATTSTTAPAHCTQDTVKAQIVGLTATFTNHDDVPCDVSAPEYERLTSGMYPQKRIGFTTVTIKPGSSETLNYIGGCTQRDAIIGTDAPETLIGGYFTPAETLLAYDVKDLWSDSCVTPKVEYSFTANMSATCASWNVTDIKFSPEGAIVVSDIGMNGSWNGTNVSANLTATWPDGHTANTTVSASAPTNCNPHTEITCPGTNRIVSDLASCVETPRSSKG